MPTDDQEVFHRAQEDLSEGAVTVLDLVANCGPARDYLTSSRLAESVS